MTERLVVCPECHRHVEAREASCPFCLAAFDASKPIESRKRGATLAAALVGIAASACGAGDASTPPSTPANPTTTVPYSGADDAGTTASAATPSTPSVPDALPDAGKRGPSAPAAVYGGPPPR